MAHEPRKLRLAMTPLASTALLSVRLKVGAALVEGSGRGLAEMMVVRDRIRR